MHWVAPSEKDTATDTLEKRLWAAADQLYANSGLTSQHYGQLVLCHVFQRIAEVRFADQRAKLVASINGRGLNVRLPLPLDSTLPNRAQ